ncbi:MAG: hypothetical protein KDK08_29610 [Rhizobiaceae bacterium]|nr:hypothetical protein [Rhizobiaceae bacterium]
MVDKPQRRGKKALTGGTGFDDNRGSRKGNAISSPIDPRITGLVRLLARKAAERDFARFARRNESEDPLPGKN